MKIRTVRLELLRPGPAHNQLLSTLTNYIALCGDAPPETFHVPFDHYRMLRRLQALRLAGADVEGALTELREDVVRTLSGIRCLATSLAEAHGDGVDLIELELVLSASELSLIPFEIAFPPGSPARELAQREVIVTRRSRRVPRAKLHWEHRPRILVLAASPPGVNPVPIAAHVAGLRAALAPWLSYLDGIEDRDVRMFELSKFIQILPNASELSIQKAMQEARDQRQSFTHVHVLAHGAEIHELSEQPEHAAFREPRFGVVLHHSHDPNRSDVLSGRRFFSAIAGTNEQCERRLPQVLTLASCDSGNVGGVVAPGASVAHDIHDGGIALVVASQFPLTYGGSAVFVQRLYERLLGGDDPRCAIRETRRAVHAAGDSPASAVDWGALVHYGALPEDLARHVHEARVRALRQRIDSAISSVDDLVLPVGESEPARAWDQAKAGMDVLRSCAEDLEVARYFARVQMRWAFLVLSAEQEPSEAWLKFAAREVPHAPPKEALGILRERGLRAFRDGLLQHYRATGNPVSLGEALAGNFFLGEPLPRAHALTAATQIQERLQAQNSSDTRRKLQRALVELWILEPAIAQTPNAGSASAEVESSLEGIFGQQPAKPSFEAIFDQQFAETSPTDYEYYAAWRHCRRIERIATLRNTPSDQRVAARARKVAEFLERRGVRTSFSAIVDWIELPDGGRRTVAT